jgi:hypothetical protein
MIKFFKIILFGISIFWGINSLESQTNTKIIKYYVKNGDSLYKISKKFYKTGKKWEKIFKNNIETIKDPNLIFPRQLIYINLTELTKYSNLIKFTNILTQTNIISESNKFYDYLSGLSHIPKVENYEITKFSYTKKSNEVLDSIPTNILKPDFSKVESFTKAELTEKENPQQKIYIAVCKFNKLEKLEKFWEDIENQAKSISNLNYIKNSNWLAINFPLTNKAYSIIKEEIPLTVSFLKSELKYTNELLTFTRLLTHSKTNIISEKQNSPKEIYILPDELFPNIILNELYIEKITEQYLKEKGQTEWAKMMLGKLNICAIYLDDQKLYWNINLFNLETEENAKKMYNELYSNPKEKLLKYKNEKSFIKLYGAIEKITIKGYNGWLIENKIKNLSEINFRVKNYIITVSVNKIEIKEKLLDFANLLNLEKIE